MVVYNKKVVKKKVLTGVWLPGAGHTRVQCLPYGVCFLGAGKESPDKNIPPRPSQVLLQGLRFPSVHSRFGF